MQAFEGPPSYKAYQLLGKIEAPQETSKSESPEGTPLIKKEELITLSKRVGLTALGLLASPGILALGGVLALSKLLTSKDKVSLSDKTLSYLILPAASRKEFPNKPPPGTHTHHFRLTGKKNKAGKTIIDGMVLLAKNMDPEISVKMPTVVLFCGNNGCMEGEYIQNTADEYRENGFNVVVFNYRGVSDSTGQVLSAQDLEEDGMTVVRELLTNGLKLDNQRNPDLKLQPETSNLILDGTSIGGAVAASVGAEYKTAILATSRTFTTWPEAARGMVSQATNPVFGWIAKTALSLTDQTKLDNVAAMKTRFSETHSVTILESVKKDSVIAESAKLNDSNLQKALPREEYSPNVFYQTHIGNQDDAYDHGSFISLNERMHLYQQVIAPHKGNLQPLKDLDRINSSLQIIKKDMANLSKRTTVNAIISNLDAKIIALNNVLKEISELKVDENNPYYTEINELAEKINQDRIATLQHINSMKANLAKPS